MRWMLLAAAIFAIAPEAPVAVDSKITSATLFSSQALVLREVEVPEGNGQRSLELGPLPAQLVDGSVEVGGDAHLRLLSVEVRRDGTGAIRESPEYKALEQQRDELAQHLAANERRRAGATERCRRLLALEVRELPRSADRPAPVAVQPESWRLYLDMVRAGLAESLKAIEEVESASADLAEKHSILEARMREMAPAERAGNARLALLVENTTGAKGKLRVAYRVRPALWYPSYTLEIDSAASALRLGFYAVAHQRSGEDWPAVPLRYSTGVPESGAELPELSEQRIARAKDGGLELEPAAAEPGEPSEGSSGEFSGLPARAVLPIESARGYSMAFASAAACAVPSDGAPHRTLIGGFALEFRQERMLVGELDPRVYRRLRLKAPADRPLPAGAAAVFLDGVYLGTVRLEGVEPGGELLVELGIDDSLRVGRSADERAEEIGYFTKGVRRRSEIGLAIENLRDVPVEVEVAERIPFSDDEQIAVAIDRSATFPANFTHLPRTGMVRWQIRIAPRETASVRLAYQVEAPKDLELTQREEPMRNE